MRAILSNQLERKLSFIELLYKHEWLNLDVIATEIGAAESTLITDIKEINEFAAPIQIVTSTKKGIRLKIPSNYSIDYVYEQILEQSIEFQLLERIFFHDYYTIRELADELYSSISQIRFKIARLNEILPVYGFSIESNPLRIIGDETTLSLFYFRYFDIAYATKALPFRPDKQAKVMKLLREAKRKPTMSLVHGLRQLSIWILVREQRIDQGYFIELADPPMLDGYHETVTPAFWEIFDSREYDRIYQDIYSQVLKLNVLLSLDTMDKVLKINEKVRVKFEAIERLLTSIERQLEAAIPQKRILALELYNTINLNDFTKHTILIHDGKEYERRFTKEFYPYFRSAFRTELEELGLTLMNPNDKVIVNEILYTLIERRPQLFEPMFATLPNIKLGVLSNSMVSNFAWTFSERFGKYYDVYSLAEADVPYLKENRFGLDILVTNINGLEIDNGETICVTSFSTPDDYRLIEDAYGRAIGLRLQAYAKGPTID